ncbi:MAG TPA: GNAT family N-acetyltransferase [Terriglobales bacterium]|nr:GNAT family N-acetyltransferase [Terriglobales bacterium]
MQPTSRDSPAELACAIRPPRPTDLDRMAALAGQLGYPSTAEQVRARLEHMQDPGGYAVFVAELPGGPLAGWIGVYMFRTVETDSHAEISGLVVDEALRSRGVGKLLLDAAEAWARSRGCGTMTVRSNVIRDRAHAFYERYGYLCTKTQKTFRKRIATLA